jgi:hypothetical protein
LVVVGCLLAVSARAGAEQLAVDGSGRAFLVGPTRSDRSATFSSVRLRSAAPGGGFGRWRTVARARRGDRFVDAGVAADGGGLILAQRNRGARRSIRAVAFTASGRTARSVAVSALAGDADFAASAVASTGAAVVVWFRHREDGRWRLEASIRDAGAHGFRRADPLSAFVRRACCTSVSAAIGEGGHAVVTWSSTSRPAVWAALRTPGRGFGRAQRLTRAASDTPKAVVGAGGTAAVIYSTQHVPLRPADGLQLQRTVGADRFGAAEHVNPGGGVTIGEAAVTAAGAITVAWLDQVHGARVHVSQGAGTGPLTPVAELGTNVSSHGLAVATDDGGRAVVAWSERASTTGPYREQAKAATSQASGAPFGPPTALGHSWRAAQPQLARLVPGGGALVLWKGSRYDGPTARRTALAVTRLP